MSFKHYCTFNEDKNVYQIFSVIKEVIFCLTKEGHWVILEHDGLRKIEKLTYDMSLLTLLELPVDKLLEKIKITLSTYQDIDFQVQEFPINEVLYSGLKSDSDYWVDLALNWVSETNIEKLSNKLVLSTILQNIEQTKHYNQKIRHRCRKLKKRVSG